MIGRLTTIAFLLAVGAVSGNSKDDLGSARTTQAQGTFYATSSHNNVRLLTLDPTNGRVLKSVEVTNEEALFGGLAADGDDLYSIDGYNDPNSDRTFRIDAETGEGTVVGDTGENWNFRSVEIHPITGVLYATRDNALYTLDKGSGRASRIAAITGSTLDQTTAVAIRGDGTAYVVDIGGTGLFRLDLQTGAATHLGDMNPGERIWFQDLAFDGLDRLWAILNGGGLYIIDIENVEANLEFSSPFYRGLAFAGGGARCNYTLKKVKAKRCDSCPRKGDNFESQAECEEKRDCQRKVKTKISCPQGGEGTCKLKAKKRRCE